MKFLVNINHKGNNLINILFNKPRKNSLKLIKKHQLAPWLHYLWHYFLTINSPIINAQIIVLLFIPAHHIEWKVTKKE